MKQQEVISTAMKICQPTISSAEKMEKVSSLVIEKMKGSINQLANDKIVGFSLGGSFAKGTWVNEDRDLDIFVKIDPSTDKEEFEDLGIKIGRLVLGDYEPYLRYSEHPYVEAEIGDIRINIVPCYNVKQGDWKSAADRSPFHTIFMLEGLSDAMKSQVRILKMFLKSIGIYGAQLSVGGFSGYVTEIMILKYGSFLQVIELIACLNHEKFVIALNGPNPESIDSFTSKIIIIDPIDNNRNLGAAISADSLGKFILAARSFLENPSLEFFKKAETSLDNRIIEKIKANLLVVEFEIRKRSPDILWGQLKKSLNALSKQLDVAGFNAIGSTCITDEKKYAAFVFFMEFMELPPFCVRSGPEVFRKDDTEIFLSNKKDELVPFWINRNMKVLTISKRNKALAKDYASEILSGKVAGVGLNKDVAADLRLGFNIYSGNERELNKSIIFALSKLMLNDRRIINSEKGRRH
jgi:tRNA nucleotidyltransferase (CCA-adding enzyme)